MGLDLNRLKAERVAKGLTQEEIAGKLGWSRQKYMKKENGHSDLGANELLQIAEVLEMTKEEVGIFFTSTVPETQR